MPIFHLKAVPTLPFNVYKNFREPIFNSFVDSGNLLLLGKCRVPYNKAVCRAVFVLYSYPKVEFSRILQLKFEMEKSAQSNKHLAPLLCAKSLLEPIINKDVLTDQNERSLSDSQNDALNNALYSDFSHVECISDKEYKEIERRRKIGFANKGNIPWNKGKKHSAETRVRIKRRTLEALRDPKVRKKMSDWPRYHTDQSKSRISLALKSVWAHRLKLKSLQQKCYSEWAQLIAAEAKKGGSDQSELDWDSFDKMKAAILQQHLQWVQNKAVAKEIGQARAKANAKMRAEKRARLAQLRKQREEEKRVKLELQKKVKMKSHERKKESATFRNLKLKARLIKIYRRRQIAGLDHPREE